LIEKQQVANNNSIFILDGHLYLVQKFGEYFCFVFNQIFLTFCFDALPSFLKIGYFENVLNVQKQKKHKTLPYSQR